MAKLSQKAFYDKWNCNKRESLNIWKRWEDNETFAEYIRIDEVKRKLTVDEIRKDLEKNFDIDTQYKIWKKIKYIRRNDALEKEGREQRQKEQIKEHREKLFRIAWNDNPKEYQIKEMDIFIISNIKLY